MEDFSLLLCNDKVLWMWGRERTLYGQQNSVICRRLGQKLRHATVRSLHQLAVFSEASHLIFQSLSLFICKIGTLTHRKCLALCWELSNSKGTEAISCPVILRNKKTGSLSCCGFRWEAGASGWGLGAHHFNDSVVTWILICKTNTMIPLRQEELLWYHLVFVVCC